MMMPLVFMCFGIFGKCVFYANQCPFLTKVYVSEIVKWNHARHLAS